MGRRKKKAVALNQSTPEPVKEEPTIVATPEQIKAMEEEGAKEIAELVDKQIQGDLEKLSEPEEPVVEKPESVKLLEEGAGLVYSEDYVEDPTIERTLVEKSPASVINDFPGVPFPEVLAPQKKLSVADKRRKLRHGMKPPTH